MSYYEYLKLHKWLRATLGKANYCSNDSSHQAKMYDWANISGEYKKDERDYKSLCRSCHIRFDGLNELTRKRSLGNKYHNKVIKQYDMNGNLIKEWESSMAVERALNITTRCISNVLAGRAKTAGRFRWSR
jgi:DNA replicative helicase MCM subunit Mcm2 (Cdc46/Mcm family)